jgi:hypothetical protein
MPAARAVPPAAPAPPAALTPGLDKKLVFSDDFERKELGPNWSFSGGAWSIQEGRIHTTRALNKCLWLTKPIPADAVIEMDAWSMIPRGDIKFTVFGDGVEHETGYTLILGGWFNSISIIARMDEHGADRKERHDKGVVIPGRKYHFEMRRLGGRIDWLVDGQLYLTYDDPAPLRGPGHDRFAFCNWESPLYFDNLKIHELAPKKAAAPARPSPAAPKAPVKK